MSNVATEELGTNTDLAYSDIELLRRMYGCNGKFISMVNAISI